MKEFHAFLLSDTPQEKGFINQDKKQEEGPRSNGLWNLEFILTKEQGGGLP